MLNLNCLLGICVKIPKRQLDINLVFREMSGLEIFYLWELVMEGT